MLFDDLADYQRCWEEIHQQTLKQIQLIKGESWPVTGDASVKPILTENLWAVPEAEEKTAASTRSHNVRVGTETKS